jgi:hypothetical protein
LKHTCLLVDSACVLDDAEEQYVDTDSEEGLDDTPLEDPASSDGSEDLEQCCKRPSDKADVH